MNDKEKDNFELEYLLESVKRYNIQEPPKESFDWLFSFALYGYSSRPCRMGSRKFAAL